MPIDFLCPNGHRLSGPSRLQGRAGQCPHCGEKFEIPIIDDAISDEELETDSPDADDPIEEFADEELDVVDFVDDGPSVKTDSVPDESEEPSFDDLEDQLDDEPAVFDDDSGDDVVSFASVAEEVSSSADETHPLYELFEMLWEEKQHGAEIKIFLGDDEGPFKPQWYSPVLSQTSHALFARKDADEKYMLTVIAWDAMERIEVGRLDELPQDAFE